ncbi:MAG: CoA transferase [Alphaproteobacteria bacterium]|jgi:crotonobetainyl-CoA:carnitine CoA-transferase CaiB-like acyl-CoA transferase
MPLSGIRVIDLGRVIAGPLGPMLLGDMGADVIKVETGQGDMLRQQAPYFGPDMGGYFATANRNKRSLHVDLRKPGGAKLLRALMASADVVVENFRPGIFDTMGFTDEVLERDFPHLVVARLSAFGDMGPMGHRSGVDQLVQGYSGLMSVTGSPETGPTRSGIAISDVMGGLCNTIGILGALMERAQSGRGQVVRTSLLEATMSMLTVQAGKFFASGQDPVAEGNHHPTIAPYGLYDTSDGQIQLLVSRDGDFRRFADFCGRPQWKDDDRFADGGARSINKGAMTDEVAKAMVEKTTAEWLEFFVANDIPHGSVLSIKEAFESAQAKALGMTLDMTAGDGTDISVPRFPWRFARTPARVRYPPPQIGEHTEEILAEVGLSDDPEVREALLCRK